MLDLKDIYKDYKKYIDKNITLQGWIKSHRKQKDFGFIDFNDGTYFKNLQVVYESNLKNFDEIAKLHIGSAITVKGKLIKSQGKQDFELSLSEITLEGDCPDDYPLQAKGRPTREFLREISYLRPRTNLFNAVFRVRSVAAYAIHKYFQDNGYVYFHAPIITASDCEGAGEMFQVTTLDLDRVAKSGKVDYSKDFFGKQAALTVSGQLQAETFASLSILITSSWSILVNLEVINLFNLSIKPFSTNESKKVISSGQLSSTYLTTYLSMLSIISISPSRSQNAISGSIIQNSEACVLVFEFSALNVGPNVYVFL